MKRFYTEVATRTEAGGTAILLDDRPVRTPARAPLLLPTPALAEAVADEWRAQCETIDPRAMPLTGLANAAIDRVALDPAAFAADLARYAEADLLAYRADDPPALIAAQAKAWDPPLAWSRARYDIHVEIATGIVHKPQPPATIARLTEAVGARDVFQLAGLSPLVTIGGSLIVALMVAEDALDADTAFDLTHLDERWQAEQWGEDALATQARDARRRDFAAAARFVALAKV